MERLDRRLQDARGRGVAARVKRVSGAKQKRGTLSQKHQAFVEAYCKSWNATSAAVATGYVERSANKHAYRLLRRPDIQAAIFARQAKNAAAADIEIREIIATLVNILRANVLDYMRIGVDGDPRLDFARLTRDQASVISELIVETRRSAVRAGAKEGEAGAASEIVKVRFKLHDKLAAADKLMKHLGGFQPERHLHTGKDGAPITLAVDDHKRAKAILALIAKMKADKD